MSAEVFIDTNFFVYHLDSTDRRKNRIAEQIVRDALSRGGACISFQVVQECLNTALRKAEVALVPEQARSYLDTVLLPLMQVPARAALYHRALDVQARWRFGFYGPDHDLPWRFPRVSASTPARARRSAAAPAH